MSKIAACVTMEGPFPEGFWFIGCRRGRRWLRRRRRDLLT
jgi:hypothetical protein